MSLDDQDLSALIRQQATRHAAPNGLRASVRAGVALAEAGRTAPSAPVPATPLSLPSAPRCRWRDVGWRTATAGFVLGVACALLAVPLWQHLGLSPTLDAELVADHVRALRVGPLTEVASSDRHTVKPWFQGRIDYAPPVFDLASDGYPLIGGRIEHVQGSTVATLAYNRNRHVIDLFVWPSSEARSAPERSQHRGYNLLSWNDGSMQYRAVSDLDAAEMQRFALLWQQRVAGQ